MKKIIDGITLECFLGNIVAQDDIDVIVNAANAHLRIGGGVAGAIHTAAGPGLAEECMPLAPIKPGESVITGGHQLPNPYVIHTLGPVYGKDKPEDKLLASCYLNSLLLADGKELFSIAFPAISTGAFGYPVEKAADVAVKEIISVIPKLKNIKKIRFVLFAENDLKVHEDAIEALVR